MPRREVVTPKSASGFLSRSSSRPASPKCIYLLMALEDYRRKRRFRTIERLHREAAVAQRLGEHEAHAAVVVDDPDALRLALARRASRQTSMLTSTSNWPVLKN